MQYWGMTLNLRVIRDLHYRKELHQEQNVWEGPMDQNNGVLLKRILKSQYKIAFKLKEFGNTVNNKD